MFAFAAFQDGVLNKPLAKVGSFEEYTSPSTAFHKALLEKDYSTHAVRCLKDFIFASLYVYGNEAKTKLVGVFRVDKDAKAAFRPNLHGHILPCGDQQDHIVILDVKLRKGCDGIAYPTHSRRLVQCPSSFKTWSSPVIACGTVDHVSAVKTTNRP